VLRERRIEQFSVDAVFPVADNDGLLLVHDFMHFGPEMHAITQGRADRLGERRRAADDPAVEATTRYDEVEVSDTHTRGDLIHVAR
jgi:hypothetical protein